MENYPTDCLVLEIREIDTDSDTLDTRMFVLYDANEDIFVVRGKRPEHEAYSFYCDGLHDLAEFIKTVVCKSNYCSFIMYNYNNLPIDSDDITFEHLTTILNTRNEITGFDNMKCKTKLLKRMLGILRNVYNYY
jgi:hypothetical protein